MSNAGGGLVTAGIHHVTAVASDPNKNIEFYTKVLGLRLVKVTVNFDDPGSYHLYFGDDAGRPGTILTFFPWPLVKRGVRGTGQVVATSFAAPEGAVGFWRDRLTGLGVPWRSADRLGEEVVAVEDPDGMVIEIVGVKLGEPAKDEPARAGVDAARALRSFRGVTLSVEGYERTAGVLTGLLGMASAGEQGNRFRFAVPEGTPGRDAAAIVDVLCEPDGRFGKLGGGIVHHVAFRARDHVEHASWRSLAASRSMNVTPIVDRSYFKSLYFREPGGVLFEIATDQPGFATDEPRSTMGTRLMLPPQYEPYRAKLAGALPKIDGLRMD